MVNSYPARTKSDNSASFISSSSCYYTARWTVPTFLSTSWMLQSPGQHHTADRTMYHFIKRVIYLQNTNYAGCFVQKCVFIVAMVIGLLLGLQVSWGLCPDRNRKTVISRKKFTIRHICTIKCTVGP